MRRIAILAGRTMEVLHDEASYGRDFKAFCRARPDSLIAFSNANYAALLPDFTENGFHLIRDPRDIVVSAYFSHLNSHPIGAWNELEAHRAELKTLDLQDGLDCEMEFRSSEFADLATWNYETPNILELRYEDLVENPQQHLLRAFDHLGLVVNDLPLVRVAGATLPCLVNTALWKIKAPGALRWSHSSIPAELLLGITHRLRFERLSGGRKRDQVNPQSHYRSGRPGGWRTSFSARNVARFKSLYPSLVPRLGYEVDDSW